MSLGAAALVIGLALAIVTIGELWHQMQRMRDGFAQRLDLAVRGARSQALARAVQVCRGNANEARQQPIGEELGNKEREALKLRNETIAQACMSCADDIRDEALGE